MGFLRWLGFAGGVDIFYGVGHYRYAILHPEWKTPWVATFVICFFGIVLLFLSCYSSSVKAILESSILAIGFQICFYMSLAGFVCAWHYRKKLGDGVFDATSFVIWPLLAGAFMVFVGLYSIPTFDTLTITMGLGGLLIGFIPLLLNSKLVTPVTIE